MAQDTAAPEAGAAPQRPSPARRERSGRRLAQAMVFPLAVVTAFVVLVGLDLNGSSVGFLGDYENPSSDPALVAGQPRSVRSDEFLIQTPNSIGNVRRGLPVEPWFGLARIRQPVVTLGAPSAYWSEALRPQNWGYFVDDSRGLAWHWWFSFLAGLLGLYALLLVLIRRVLLGAALAVVGAMTPYTAWWSAPSTVLLLGFATGATACTVLSLRIRRTRAAVALAVAAGLQLAALALTLYPPWQISLGLLGAAVVVGQAIDHRAGLRRTALTVAIALTTAAAPLAVWFAQNRDAIAAIAGTFYPGNRISAPGEAYLARLLNAPLNPWMAGDAGVTLKAPEGATGYATYANLSEASSSWLPVGVLLAVVLVALVGLPAAVRGRRHRDAGTDDSPQRPLQATFWIVTLMTGLLGAWALLPLPAWVGWATALNRVPPWRLPLALGLGALLMVALAGELARRRRPGPFRVIALITVLGAGVALSVASTLWSVERTLWSSGMISTPLAALSGLAVAAGFAVVAFGWGRRPAALLLAGYCLWSWALVNPLYRGLGPLDSDPVVRAMHEVEERRPGTVVAVYGDFRLVALVASSGVQSLSGVTFYPDAEVMTRLVPTGRALWNNYASWLWVADPSQSPASVRQVRGTTMELRIDPCDPRTLALGMTWALSQEPIDVPCLRPVDSLDSPGSGRVYRYEVARP